MAGYSQTPLIQKLGIKPGFRVHLADAPDGFLASLGPLPEGVVVLKRLTGKADLIHLFATRADVVAPRLALYREHIIENGIIWVSWPKKAAKMPTDLTEDVLRDIALPLGLVDIKVCAVDAVWSALKFVIRVENRREAP